MPTAMPAVLPALVLRREERRARREEALPPPEGPPAGDRVPAAVG
jgi:hypothetical protein